MKTNLLLALFVIINAACQKPQNASTNKFSDTLSITISDAQDKRAAVDLIPFFKHPSPLHRAEAVRAFASIQDSSRVEEIGDVLQHDADTAVRKAAAFALGQTYCRHSEKILFAAYSKETNRAVRAEILEGYGRVTKKWMLELSTDTILQRAFAWALYRTGLTGAGDSVVNILAASLLTSLDTETRLGAAHYFARSAAQVDAFQTEIIRTAREDPSDLVRMAAAFALRKIKSPSSQNACEKIAIADSSYRVRVNAIRALHSFPAEKTKDALIKALSDKNINVGIAASEVIRDYPATTLWRVLVPIIGTQKDWRIQANLYEAAVAASGDPAIFEEIRSLYLKSTNPYQKAALLSPLQHRVENYNFVQAQFKDTNIPVIHSSAATCLVAMNHDENFDIRLRKRFAGIYRDGIATGDAAVIAIMASALAEPGLAYKKEIKDFTFLYDAKKKLSLPKDNETLQSLDAAIDYLEGREVVPVRNQFNHPIDWALVKTISRDQRATLYTNKGNISMRLFVEEAPGSVANFVALVNQNYFNYKFFHRVVPNFVVQGGCNRGDGFGSEDYSIRSEFSGRRYKTGSVGMASAGKDTEGTQWFITHSPTPHLDGRYTIFAEVESGMEVVDRLEVGDKILKIELK